MLKVVFSGFFAVLTQVGMLVSLASLAGASEVSRASTASSALDHLVSIEVSDPSAPDVWHLRGSGTLTHLAGEPVVVTAAHVLELDGATLPSVRVCGLRTQRKCEVSSAMHLAEEGDVGVILLREDVTTPAKISRRGLKVGDHVTSVGIPEGYVVAFDGQVISRVRPGKFWMLGWCSGGSSGGGVFDDRGRLAGVVTSYKIEPQLDGSNEAVIPSHELCGIEEFSFPKTSR